MFILIGLGGCGTVGGAISGAGSDIQKAGDWLKKNKVRGNLN